MAEATICDFCRENVLEAKTSWGFHHPSYVSLVDSAEGLCAFCTLLDKDRRAKWKVLNEFQAVDSSVQRWLHPFVFAYNDGGANSPALYLWNIRTLGKTRESKEMVAITFRVVPKNSNRRCKQAGVENETFGLPERIFYCFPETELGDLMEKRDLGTSTNPYKTRGVQINRWLKICDENHKHCPAQTRNRNVFVPTRLLEIGTKGSKEKIKVVETKANNIKGPYATLSHCWGIPNPEISKKDALTQKTKFELMSVGIEWEMLSRNFKQAIKIARFLRLEYMWIDSLCIIQGDKADWTIEGSLMHKVYRNSYCNIAAADAKDSAGGLFREREPFEVLPARFAADGISPTFGRKTWRIVREDLWEQSLLKTPLYGRGWVFQERMLSPRALHFSQHQIFWDCAEMSACETLPSGLPLPLDRTASADRHWRGRLQESGTSKWVSVSGANDQSIENFWKIAVRSYTSCDLTNQGDKLIAVWGIAKLLRDSLGEDYGAGLWEHALAEQLAWRVADCTKAERPEQMQVNPSWTWTSVKGVILLADRLQPHRVYTVTDHDRNPIAFSIEGTSRPTFHRERSDDIKEEIAFMRKAMEFVEDKRKNSSTSELAEKRKNSTPTQLTDKRTVSSPDEQSVPTKEDSENYERDQEPKLIEKAIPMKGYINNAPISWSKVTGKCTLDLTNGTDFTDEDAVVGAFPDTKQVIGDGTSSFVVLSLTHYSGSNHNVSCSSEPDEGSWYSGVGIMLQSLEKKPSRYRRTGALHFEYLSAEMWGHLRSTSKDESGTNFLLE